jgi:hypothetical protein
MVVVATSLALAGACGIPCAVYVLLVVACARGALSGNRDALVALAVLLVGFVLYVLVAPHISVANEAVRRAMCESCLKHIALALHNYRDAYGRFPPPYLADKDGNPARSWRVLILPYTAQPQLYNQYTFKEPWNGPTNAKLAASRPWFYVCATEQRRLTSGPTSTNYLAVVGPGTVWAESPTNSAAPPLPSDAAMKPPGGVSAPKAKLPDAGSKILVVEVANSGFHWMEPRDLTLEEALAGINPESSPAISSEHKPRGAGVAFADSTVLFLPANTPPDLLKALITEGLDDAKRARIEALTPDPNQYMGLRFTAWALSILALLVHGLIVDVRRKRAAAKTAPDPAAAAPASRRDA